MRVICAPQEKRGNMQTNQTVKQAGRQGKSRRSFGAWIKYQLSDWKKALKRDYDVYLLILPVVVFFIIFSYIPMYGVQIAFKNYSPAQGFAGSPWVGLTHLTRFINSLYFGRVIKNTLLMSVYSLIISIPAPVILALLFNEIRTRRLKVTMQAISYAPNFISTVVMVSMIVMFLTPQTGFLDAILRMFGYSADQSILNNPDAFYHIYVWTGVWQGMGWSSVIYSAAIEGVPVDMYEAARLDGASKLKQIWYITIPSISPTIIILAIMAIGNVLNIGYEKVFLMQNSLNQTASEIISTYVYKSGLQQAQYSFSTMVGLFNNVINFAILVAANAIAKRVSETSLW